MCLKRSQEEGKIDTYLGSMIRITFDFWELIQARRLDSNTSRIERKK